VESQALYNILEDDIIPCFYNRKNGDLPDLWLKKMKSSMKMAIQQFSAKKMVNQYNSLFYAPAARQLNQLTANNAKEAKQLHKQHQRLIQNWHALQIGQPVRETHGVLRVGKDIRVSVETFLGNLRPEEVDVELYYGTYKSLDAVDTSQVKKMTVSKSLGDGKYLYDCHISCDISGRYGFTARIVPRGDDLIQSAPGLITWA
jgi:starch phosphorylase